MNNQIMPIFLTKCDQCGNNYQKVIKYNYRTYCNDCFDNIITQRPIWAKAGGQMRPKMPNYLQKLRKYLLDSPVLNKNVENAQKTQKR